MWHSLREHIDLSLVGTIANAAGIALLAVASIWKTRADSTRARKKARKFNILFWVSLGIGAVLGGLGLLSLAYWGDAKTSEHFDAKIAEFRSQLQEVRKSAPKNSEQEKQVEKLDNDFTVWAQDFVNNRRIRRLRELPREQ